MKPFFCLTFLILSSFCHGTEALENNLIAAKKRCKTKTTPCIEKPYHPSGEDQQNNLLSSHFQFGPSYTYARITPKGLPTSGGNLGGLQAQYDFQTPNRIYGGLSFLWRLGDTSGSLQKRSLLWLNVEERIGYTFGDECESWFVSLFSGFGYRHFGERVRSLGNSLTFRYNTFYFPLGILINGMVNPNFYLGLNFTWLGQVYSTLRMVPLKGARWISENEVTNMKVELPFTFIASHKHDLSLVFSPFFETWKDGKVKARSQNGLEMLIPSNRYLFYGITANLKHSF